MAPPMAVEQTMTVDLDAQPRYRIMWANFIESNYGGNLNPVQLEHVATAFKIFRKDNPDLDLTTLPSIQALRDALRARAVASEQIRADELQAQENLRALNPNITPLSTFLSNLNKLKREEAEKKEAEDRKLLAQKKRETIKTRKQERLRKWHEDHPWDRRGSCISDKIDKVEWPDSCPILLPDGMTTSMLEEQLAPVMRSTTFRLMARNNTARGVWRGFNPYPKSCRLG